MKIDSRSAAEDLGLIGLRDLALAAEGMDYRVVGGHMVLLLQLVYPTANAHRTTADVDAALQHEMEAAGGNLHEALTKIGYEAVRGNRYERTEGGAGSVTIDLLLKSPDNTHRRRLFGGRQFDAVPGLNLALSEDPIRLHADARLRNGDGLAFEVPIPGVEAALVLKAASWLSRRQAKDLTDINALLEITNAHKDAFDRWGIGDHTDARRGSRKDACRTLHSLAADLDRKRITVLPQGINPARMAALIRAHAVQPC